MGGGGGGNDHKSLTIGPKIRWMVNHKSLTIRPKHQFDGKFSGFDHDDG